jgi:hypothetical protein
MKANLWPPSSRSSLRPLMPYPRDLVAKNLYPPNIPRDAVVSIMTIEHCRQPDALLAERPVPVGPAPVLDRDQRAGKAAFGRRLPRHVLTLPRFSPRVGEAEEVEEGSRGLWAIFNHRAAVDGR